MGTHPSKDSRIASERRLATEVLLAELTALVTPSQTPGQSHAPPVPSPLSTNLLHRHATPYLHLLPTHASQIPPLIRLARTHKLRITVRSTGSSFSGYGTTDRGLLLDLSRLRDVKLHRKENTNEVEGVSCGGGATWGDINKALVDGCCEGWVPNGPRGDGSEGVVGFLLGGGLGVWSRLAGMGCDSVVKWTVVTAAGELVTVSEKDGKDTKEGRLFWALRGGGLGGLVVVVGVRLRMVKVPERVVAGRWVGRADEKLNEAVDQRWYAIPWSDQTTVDTHWTVSTPGPSTPTIRFAATHAGAKPDFDSFVDRVIQPVVPDLADKLKAHTISEPTTLFLHETLAELHRETAAPFQPDHHSYRAYASFVFHHLERGTAIGVEYADEALQTFQEQFIDDAATLEVSWLHGGGGAIGRLSADNTAFPWRSGIFFVQVSLRWHDKFLSAKIGTFLDGLSATMRSISIQQKAALITLAGDGQDEGYEQAFYGGNYAKLQVVKQEWDPEDYFHVPRGIRLPGFKLEGKVDEVNGRDGVPWRELGERQWRSRGESV
ncbi:hypothetical protein B0J18DRAFT_375563 [Chaetomium sp. MPI-SDFR-AT-0129]|nr:hypothetical protein B0J18DRAFT_375563 [Chaetomium sp. MPI-SDFR-AT-0129]